MRPAVRQRQADQGRRVRRGRRRQPVVLRGVGDNKPTVGGVELLPVDAQRKNGFALFGANDSVLGPWGTLGKDVLHAKTAAVVYVQSRDRLRGDGREGILESAAIKPTLVGFPSTATDLTGHSPRPARRMRT